MITSSTRNCTVLFAPSHAALIAGAVAYAMSREPFPPNETIVDVAAAVDDGPFELFVKRGARIAPHAGGPMRWRR